ncbi:MAG: chromate transporter [Armatimonadota bacterium]|nr:chromate transporter [Armatimonadota bacterium]
MAKQGESEKGRARPTLWQFFSVLLVVGTIAIGGGRSIIAMLERELVVRRAWLGREEFADTYAMAHIIPGVYSVNFGVILGFRFFGGVGALLAAIALVFPSFLMVLLLSKGYALLRHTQAVQGAFQAVAPAVVGMFSAILVGMGRTLLRTPLDAIMALFAFGGFLWFHLHPAFLLLAAGGAGYLLATAQRLGR